MINKNNDLILEMKVKYLQIVTKKNFPRRTNRNIKGFALSC